MYQFVGHDEYTVRLSHWTGCRLVNTVQVWESRIATGAAERWRIRFPPYLPSCGTTVVPQL